MPCDLTKAAAHFEMTELPVENDGAGMRHHEYGVTKYRCLLAATKTALGPI